MLRCVKRLVSHLTWTVLQEQTANLMQEKTKENNMNIKFIIIAISVIGFVALMIWGVEATMCKEALNCVAK